MNHCTDPDCLGWTFDGLMATIHACDVCQVLKVDAEAASAFREFMKRFPVPVMEGQCHPTCRGWNLFDGDASVVPDAYLDWCDDCEVFPNGDAAVDAALEWVMARRAEAATAMRRAGRRSVRVTGRAEP